MEAGFALALGDLISEDLEPAEESAELLPETAPALAVFESGDLLSSLDFVVAGLAPEFLKSVSYQPEPLSLNAAAVNCFRKLGL